MDKKEKKPIPIVKDRETYDRIFDKLERGDLVSTESRYSGRAARDSINNYWAKKDRQPADAAAKRHEKNRLLREFVIDEFRKIEQSDRYKKAQMAGKKPSARSCAIKILPLATLKSQTLGAEALRTDRALQTVLDWIRARDK